MLPPASPGPTIGVSGGAGDPLEALVVDVEAVESKRSSFVGWGAISPSFCGYDCPCAAIVLVGGLWGARAKSPSLSVASVLGDSGSGFGAFPRLSAKRGPLLSVGLTPILGVVSYRDV